MKIDSKFLQTYVIASAIAITLMLVGMIYQGIVLNQINRRVEQTDCDASSQPNNPTWSVNGFSCSYNWLGN